MNDIIFAWMEYLGLAVVLAGALLFTLILLSANGRDDDEQ